MKRFAHAIACGTFVGTLFFEGITEAQVQPPPPPPTIWNLLGIPTTIDKLRAQVVNRRGNRPRLEKKPPLKTIGDPANLLAPNQAIRTAAEIKQQEDLKLQKIKALKYLASIGCGCYNKEGKVTKALIAGMNDCTEEVRLAAVQAISTAASGEQCEHCKGKSCCNEEIAEELVKIAYQYDDKGCMLEPSERVREAAKEALCICCPGGPPPIKPEAEEPTDPEKTPEGSEEKKPEGDDEAPAPPKVDTTYNYEPRELTPRSSRRSTNRSASNGRVRSRGWTPQMESAVATFAPAYLDDEDTIEPPPATLQTAQVQPAPIHSPAIHARTISHRAAPVTQPAPVSTQGQEFVQLPPARSVQPQVQPILGSVGSVNPKTGIIHFHLDQSLQLSPGAVVRVQHVDSAEMGPAEVVIVDSQPGVANGRLKFFGKAPKIVQGDRIISYQ